MTLLNGNISLLRSNFKFLMKTPNTKYQILQPKAGRPLDKNIKNILLIILFVLAFGERVFFDMGPNFELVTTALILSSFYLGRRESLWIVFLIMLLSDLVIGNTNIFIFTWSGFLIPALFLNKSRNTSPLIKALNGTLAGVTANLFFFIWTNFGVWLLSGMYAKTTTGLLMSYINALPFLRYQLTSTLIFIPSAIILTELGFSLAKKYKLSNKSNFIFNPSKN